MNKTVVMLCKCGGNGRLFGDMVEDRIGFRPGLKSRIIDTSTPDGVPKSTCIEISPQFLPSVPANSVAAAMRMTPIKDAEEFRQYRDLVSARGLAQAPFMCWIAGLENLSEIKEAIEVDVRALAQAVGGADRFIFITVASALGGTGTPAARVAGCALRLAAGGTYLPQETRWAHVLVSSAVLGDGCRTRRTIALERRQLEEFEKLMQPGAELPLPGQMDPIRQPGPDDVVVISSSAEAPRTLEDAADELGAVVQHWLGSEDVQ